MSHLTPELIEALARGERKDPHLSECETCRTSVKDARGRQRLLDGLTPYTLSDMAFRRVEARLSEQVEQGVPSAGARWLWWLVPAAAVAALVAFVAVNVGERRPGPELRRGAIVEVAHAPFSPLTVVAASGDAQVRHADGSWRAVLAGEVLSEGTALSGRRVVLAPDSEATQVFEASGSIALGGQATVALGAGTLTVRVSGSPVEIVAGSRRFIASEAVFLVSRAAAEVVLELSEGSVEVADSSSSARAQFSAPVHLRWADDTALRRGQVTKEADVAPISVPRRPWVGLDLSGLPLDTAVVIDAQSVGTTPLSLLLEAGRHRVQVTPKGEPTRELWVDLVGGRPSLLAWPPPSLSAPEPKEPDAESLRRVLDDLRRQRPKLAACYEKWLKANPVASGQVELVLSVSANGAVRSAEVKGEPISPESAACLVRTAKTLVLAPLGVDQDIAVPLVFRPKGR